MKKTILLVLAFSFLPFGIKAQTSNITEENIGLFPNWSEISLSDLNPIAEGGESEKWQAGDRIEEVLTLGDLEDSLAPQLLSEKDIYRRNNPKSDPPSDLDDTPLKDYKDYEDIKVSEVSGLSELALSDYPNPVSSSLNLVGRIDMIWGNVETNKTDTISGSRIEGFNVPCQSECAYLELDDIENLGRTIAQDFEGSQWIVGKNNWVTGGSGCLVGKEPTGIHPFGDVFKSVLWETDESQGTAEIVMFFNFKTTCGESPYVIGPVPFPLGKVKENDFVYLGSGM